MVQGSIYGEKNEKTDSLGGNTIRTAKKRPSSNNLRPNSADKVQSFSKNKIIQDFSAAAAEKVKNIPTAKKTVSIGQLLQKLPASINK
jgi:hypothetical protein